MHLCWKWVRYIRPNIAPLMLLYLEVGTFALPPRQKPVVPIESLNNLYITAKMCTDFSRSQYMSRTHGYSCYFGRWFVDVSNHVCQWLVRMSVVTDHTCGWKLQPSFYWKWRWVLWFRRIWNIFAQLFVFAVVGFSKCKSYLNEREECYGRQIYSFNPRKMAKKNCHAS